MTAIAERLPEFITFTGADDRTSIEGMRAMSVRYPIEWGVLFSPSRQGVDPRYPGGEMQSRLLWSGLRMSAHLCGGHARAIMADDDADTPVDLAYFARIQINHAEPNLDRIRRFRRGWGPRCIAQTRADVFPQFNSVDWLFDRSGGTGKRPAAWPAHPGRLVGYAGGITPATVADDIRAINSQGPYWIDMESGVRADNWFDLALCLQVCEAVYGKRPL